MNKNEGVKREKEGGRDGGRKEDIFFLLTVKNLEVWHYERQGGNAGRGGAPWSFFPLSLSFFFLLVLLERRRMTT